jgi:Glycine rich protein
METSELQSIFSPSRLVPVALCALLAACASGSSPFAPRGAQSLLAPATVERARTSAINVDPRRLDVNTLQTAEVTVDEDGSTAKFTTSGSKACRGLVTWSPQKAKTKAFHVKVTAGAKKGSCVITFADAHNNTARLPVVVRPEPTSASFAFGGYAQNFTVPNGVLSVTIAALGAQGGYAAGGGGTGGGLGGSVTATVPVKPGAVLSIYVGGMGGNYQGTIQGGGFNGGGAGGCGCGAGSFGPAGSGGGASDVRVGKGMLSDRIVVAGGGGGSGYEAIAGGAGGGLTGGDGTGTAGYGGAGASQTAGGTGGAIGLYGPAACNDGTTGVLGVGGTGGGTLNGTQCSAYGGGGGGGGYYGGGGGGAGGAYPNGTFNQGSGGGGSGFAEPSATNVVMATGVQAGNGSVKITWKNP